MLAVSQTARFQYGSVLVAVYRNADAGGRAFVDVVIYRRVNGSFRRGANLKPADLPVLADLLLQAGRHIQAGG